MSTPTPRARVRPSLVLLLAGLASCGDGGRAEAGWTRLAAGHRPASAAGLLAAWGLPGQARVDPEEGGLWVEVEVPAAEWGPRRQGQGLRLKRPALPGFGFRPDERLRLRLADGREVRRVQRQDFPGGDAAPAEPLFALTREALFLRLPAGEEPGGPATLAAFLARGGERDGVWRIARGDLAADGVPVWPGERVRLVERTPPASRLRFQLDLRPLVAEVDARLVVTVGGRSVHEEVLTPEAVVLDPARALALPAAGGGALEVSVSGGPALVSLLDPVLGPAEVGSYGGRPWGETRPDLVVLLLDTFRADNLAAWGGDPSVAPHLNALAAGSLRFLQARSTAVWTLPSHGSLFSGVYPPQHGAVDHDLAMPGELVTLAERLSEFGYRTGAVTDSGLVSRRYGLDQGFEWFQETPEEERHLGRTFAEAARFLDADDGRPVFLFVHTYRAHAPYRTGLEEDTAADVAINARMDARLAAWRAEGHQGDAVLAEFRDEYLRLYREGVRGLDAAVGPWLDELATRGLRRSGYLVVTSDHGEEFFEHGHRYHGAPHHEEKIRVPFFLTGPGLAPGEVTLGSSHIDFAPTLAALAGVPAAPAWEGRPLLALRDERLLFSSHGVAGQFPFVTVVEGGHKVYAAEAAALARGEVLAAYDLERDPRETTAFTAETAPWSVPFAERAGAAWTELSVPLGRSRSVELDAEAEQDLRHLGYVE